MKKENPTEVRKKKSFKQKQNTTNTHILGTFATRYNGEHINNAYDYFCSAYFAVFILARFAATFFRLLLPR